MRSPRRILRWLGRPWMSALLLAYLVFNATMQPSEKWDHGPTVVGSLFERWRAHPRINPGRTPEWRAWPVGGSWKLAAGYDWVNQSPSAMHVVHSKYSDYFGVWSPVLRKSSSIVHVDVETLSGTPLPAPTAASEQAIFTAINASFPGELPTDPVVYAPGGRIEWTILWPGVFNDATVLLAFALLGGSLVWVPRFLRRVFRRPPIGRCGNCGYNLVGLPDGAVCPECGQ